MSILHPAEQALGYPTTPILWINKYLSEKLANELQSPTIPFVPTSPNAIDDVMQAFPQFDGATGVMMMYDRMGRMRRTPFPHIKGEELLYYLYANGQEAIDTVITIQELIMRIMDREDETAEEINAWMRGKDIGGVPPLFYFHRFKVYQLQETRDIIDFGTARTIAGNKFIIDFEYHRMPEITNA